MGNDKLKNPSWVTNLSNGIIFIIVSIILSVSINFYINWNIIRNEAFQATEITSVNANQSIEKIVDNNYNDFLTQYYEHQAGFLNFWLTLLAIFAGFAGIGIPLLLNASYKEKIREMECEFDRKNEKMSQTIIENAKITDKAKQTVIEMRNNFNNEFVRQTNLIEGTIEEAKLSFHSIQVGYDVELKEFRANMQKAVLEAKTSAILAEINSLIAEARSHNKKSEREKEIEKYNKVISLGTSSLQTYKECAEFCKSIKFKLSDVHYSRGLYYTFAGHDYKKAIIDYEKCIEIDHEILPEESSFIKILLAKCYISDNQFAKALKVLTEINKEKNKESINDYLNSEKLFAILRESKDEAAPVVLKKLEELTEP